MKKMIDKKCLSLPISNLKAIIKQRKRRRKKTLQESMKYFNLVKEK